MHPSSNYMNKQLNITHNFTLTVMCTGVTQALTYLTQIQRLKRQCLLLKLATNFSLQHVKYKVPRIKLHTHSEVTNPTLVLPKHLNIPSKFTYSMFYLYHIKHKDLKDKNFNSTDILMFQETVALFQYTVKQKILKILTFPNLCKPVMKPLALKQFI